MATFHETTQEEEAYERFLDENQYKLSPAARALIREAVGAAYAENLVASYCFQPEEYEIACENMSLSAVVLTDLDLELLKQLVRRLLVAGASIDPFDDHTLVGPRMYRRDLYRFYDTAAHMIRSAIFEEVYRRLRQSEN